MHIAVWELNGTSTNLEERTVEVTVYDFLIIDGHTETPLVMYITHIIISRVLYGSACLNLFVLVLLICGRSTRLCGLPPTRPRQTSDPVFRNHA